MKGSLFIGLVLTVLLASAVSAASTTNWTITINDELAVNNGVTTSALFLGEPNTVRLDFNALNNAQNVVIFGRLRGQEGLFTTQPFNIVNGSSYTKYLSFKLPSNISADYIGRLLIWAEVVNHTDFAQEFWVNLTKRIPIKTCGALNITNGYYVLQNNVNSLYSCFLIKANGINLDLQGHTLNGSSQGYGVTFTGTGPSTNLVIKNGKIQNFRMGAYFSGTHYSKLINLSIMDNTGVAIYLIAGSNNVIRNNIIARNNMIGYDSSLLLESSSNDYISDNKLAENNGGIYVWEGSNDTIQNNYINYSGERAAITFDETSNSHLINNRLENNLLDFSISPAYDGDCNNTVINLTSSNGNILFYNDQVNLSDVKASELILCNADGSLLKNVRIFSKGQPKNGLFLTRTNNASLTGIFVDNTKKGLSIISSGNNVLSDIYATNNFESGIILIGSYLNNVSRAYSINNAVGITISGSENTINSNYIKDNLVTGIQLDYALHNVIYNNFLRNNVNLLLYGINRNDLNATFISASNIINGPFMGGNVWASPNGTGFSESCLDLDNNGICDQIYTIDAYHVDYLPLKV